MFKYLVLAAGILFITALVNSLVGTNRTKWFPMKLKKIKDIEQDAFKSSQELVKNLNLLISPEGILIVIVYIILVLLYSLGVWNLL